MFYLFLLGLFYVHTAIAYPSAPGTCNLSANRMALVGHGPSKSTCLDCYGVSIHTDQTVVNIKLTGKFAYQGIVMLVKEKHTNKTVGEFKRFDQDLFTSVACDDDEDEQDQIEADTTAVIGHVDAKLKNWPVNVDWNMDLVDRPAIELKLQTMVVYDYENFHVLPETEFKLKRKVIVTTKPSASKEPIVEPKETLLEVEHPENVSIEMENNQLFIWTFLLLSIFYCSLSICLRRLLNGRRKRQALDDELELMPPLTLKEN